MLIVAQGKYFELEKHDEVAVFRINGPDKMNTINQELSQEVDQLWRAHIDGNTAIKAAVFISKKPDNFIAGADIRMIKGVEDKSKLYDLTQRVIRSSST